MQYISLTQPDISFTDNKMSQYRHRPTYEQWNGVKHILRFLFGRIKHALSGQPQTCIYLHKIFLFKKILSYYLIDLCQILNLSNSGPKKIINLSSSNLQSFYCRMKSLKKRQFCLPLLPKLCSISNITQNNETISFLQVLRSHYWFTKNNPFVHNYRSELKKKQTKKSRRPTEPYVIQ